MDGFCVVVVGDPGNPSAQDFTPTAATLVEVRQDGFCVYSKRELKEAAVKFIEIYLLNKENMILELFQIVKPVAD